MPDETTGRAYTTALLTGETWEDFVALVEANNGVWGGCWCMGFHPEGLDRTSARHNRENKHSHVRQGTVHQVLVYDGKDCVGWCQYGTPAELPTINNPRRTKRSSSSYRTGGSAASSRGRGIVATGLPEQP